MTEKNIITCPHCGNINTTIEFYDNTLTKFMFRCSNCNIVYTDIQKRNPITPLLSLYFKQKDINKKIDEELVLEDYKSRREFNWGEDPILDEPPGSDSLMRQPPLHGHLL